MKLEKGGTYILIKEFMEYNQTPFKAKVLEVTETTYLIHYLDTDRKERHKIDKFDIDHKILETVSTLKDELERIKHLMKDTKPEINTCPNSPGLCYCTGKCRKKVISIKCPYTGYICECNGTCPKSGLWTLPSNPSVI